MSSTLALVWGVCVFLIFCLALIPCLGWINWFNIGLACLGIVFSIVAMTKNPKVQGPAIVGLVLNGIAACLGFLRLILGGGLV